MKPLSFDEKLELGRLGEDLVTGWFKSKGFGVIPSSEFTGKNNDKAPRLHFEARSFVTPDLDVCRNGARYWGEVKTSPAAPTMIPVPEALGPIT